MKSNLFQATCRFCFLYLCTVASIGCTPNEYVEKPSGYYDEDPIRTAEELLAELETQPDRWGSMGGEPHRTTYLPEEELKIVADTLSKRHPIQSLRHRLHFQDTHPKPVTRVPTGTGRQYQDGFFSQRARALSELHSEEVHRFINRNGQGVMRMPPPEPADLYRWGKYAKQIPTVEVDSKILGETVIELTDSFANEDASHWDVQHFAFDSNGMPSLDLAKRFHETTAKGFAFPDTLGYVKNIDEVAGFEAHKVRFSKNSDPTMRPISKDELEKRDPDLPGIDVSWKLNRIELVSLLMHDEPRVYETENLPDMEKLSGSDVETRSLNEFENRGLEKLNDGEEIFTVATHNRIVMLGAVRADNSCKECHSVRRGDLLGAFSYEFLRDPVEPEPSTEQKSL